MPDRPPQKEGKSVRQKQLAALGRGKSDTRPTEGRPGEDERTEAAIRVSHIHGNVR